MSTCVDSLSLALGQISFAVSDLTKKNYKATLKEIHEVKRKNLCVLIINGIYLLMLKNAVYSRFDSIVYII